MDETLKMDSHLSSAAAFVEGGVQDACDDACSICLEVFCESDPSTVTSCKHEFHLQCILEWCQRSAQCPMCWQAISLKDPTSQELLEAVERERSIRSNRTRNSAILHHPTLGDFELQHFPVGTNDAELEERIIQHLAAAAAMGRAHHIARRDGQHGSSAAQGRPQFLLFSTHPNTATGNAAANSAQIGENELAASSSLLTSLGQETPHQVPHVTPAQADQIGVLPSGTSIPTASRPDLSNNRRSAGQSTPTDQDRAGPSDFQTFSETLKSRLNAVSTRYKDSITKSTRGWKERLFSRNNSVADLSSEVRREVNAGIATVSRMIERLDTRESRRASSASATQNTEEHSSASATQNTEEHSSASATQNTEEHSVMQPSNGRIPEKHIITHPSESNQSASCTAASGPN